jgi:hypothetical protein
MSEELRIKRMREQTPRFAKINAVLSSLVLGLLTIIGIFTQRAWDEIQKRFDYGMSMRLKNEQMMIQLIKENAEEHNSIIREQFKEDSKQWIEIERCCHANQNKYSG